MGLRVHILREPDPGPLALLHSRLAPDVRVTVGDQPPEPADYQILVAGRPERQHITSSSNLRAVIVPWAGLPPATRALLLDFPRIAVHNLHHNAPAAAEMAVTLMLAAAKSIVPADRALRENDWSPRYGSGPAMLVAGKTALILGYGAIGQRVGRLCRGLGMDVIATRRRTSAAGLQNVYPPEALVSLLPRADFLIVCLPLTSETEGLIGQRHLNLLPTQAVLVNVGRGGVLDEGALYRALRDGVLYAAGLDVWYNYPTSRDDPSGTPPSAYPFAELDNVVMSPHRAGAGGAEAVELRRMAGLAALLNAAARGQEMPNRVDLEAGY